MGIIVIAQPVVYKISLNNFGHGRSKSLKGLWRGFSYRTVA